MIPFRLPPLLRLLAKLVALPVPLVTQMASPDLVFVCEGGASFSAGELVCLGSGWAVPPPKISDSWRRRRRPGPWTGGWCGRPAGLRPSDGGSEGPCLRAPEVAVSGARDTHGAERARAVERGLGLRPIADGASALAGSGASLGFSGWEGKVHT
ncbi:hypothetical protein NDU88_002799 [Pleurodeles waltl]|uniref:Secreted protein n=1 Tax=Pleurodeles waltl TaxID=8319 RepID=A0AAV7LGQ4_PLEWA|nr:hypothetical protein NDU88_002799 [Pleurodeles waltl]